MPPSVSNIPPLVHEFDWAPIHALAAQREDIIFQMREARRAYDALPHERDAAVKEDGEEFGRALRQGTDDPGGRHLAAHEAKAQAIERKQAGLVAAMASIDKDLVAAIGSEGPTMAAQVSHLIVREGTGLLDEIDRVQQSLGRWLGYRDLLLWVNAGGRGQPSNGDLQLEERTLGPSPSAAAVLRELRAQVEKRNRPVGEPTRGGRE